MKYWNEQYTKQYRITSSHGKITSSKIHWQKVIDSIFMPDLLYASDLAVGRMYYFSNIFQFLDTIYIKYTTV